MNQKFLIIGGVAAGTKVAAKVARENPSSDVTLLTDEGYISYAGCGLPYYIGDVIKEREKLTVTDPEKLKSRGIDVKTYYRAEKILPKDKKVIAKNLKTNTEKRFSYDKLILATGASPIVPPVEGVDLENVFTLRKITDAFIIKDLVDTNQIKKAVVVGGGFIGLEVAENLALRGIKVTLVELLDHILPNFDKEIALIAQNHLEEKGIRILTGDKANKIKGDNSGKVRYVETDSKKLEADMVILSVGVRPNSQIASKAGIELGIKDTIKVNANMETNIKDIYAVGDCAENINLITGDSVWYPMGSTANKMGRVAALNALNKHKNKLKGVLGTTVVKLFDINAARTGLSEREAKEKGYDIVTVLVPVRDIAHYYPGAKYITTKLIVERPTHRLLGAQIIGEGVVDKPIDIAATVITFKGTVDDMVNLDLAYAPPFSSAMSSTITAAQVAQNKLTGRVKGISPLKLYDILDDENLQLLDVRKNSDSDLGTIPNSVCVPFDKLNDKIEQLDKNKKTVLICKVGQNAYFAYTKLKNEGFKDIQILDGGIIAWPFKKTLCKNN